MGIPVTTSAATARAYRAATVEDLPRLCEMFEAFRAASVYAQYGPANVAVSTAFLASLLRSETSVVLVACEGDALVGMIGVVVLAHPLDGHCYATELFWWVEPTHRGHGTWLLRHAERWASAHGARRLIMVAPAGAFPIARMYELLGYQPVETSWQKSLEWLGRKARR